MTEKTADLSYLSQGVAFLTNPNSRNYSLDQKVSFLESKGFSSDDIVKLMKLTSTTAGNSWKDSALAGLSSSVSSSSRGWLWSALSVAVCVGVGSAMFYLTREDDSSHNNDEAHDDHDDRGGDDSVTRQRNSRARGYHLPTGRTLQQQHQQRRQSSSAMHRDTDDEENDDGDGDVIQFEKIYAKQDDDEVEELSRFDIIETEHNSPFRNADRAKEDDKLDHILKLLDKQCAQLPPSDPPRWAVELIGLTKDLVGEVKQLRVSGGTNNDNFSVDSPLKSSASRTATAVDESTETVNLIDSRDSTNLRGHYTLVREAVLHLLSHCSVTQLPSEQQQQQQQQQQYQSYEKTQICAGALAMYISNVLDQSNNSRYHKISITNAAFKNNVLPIKGHVNVLTSIGFQARGGYFEWAWRAAESGTFSGSSTTVSSSVALSEIDKKALLNECIDLLKIVKSNSLEIALQLIGARNYEAKIAELLLSVANSQTGDVKSVSSPAKAAAVVPKFNEILSSVKPVVATGSTISSAAAAVAAAAPVAAPTSTPLDNQPISQQAVDDQKDAEVESRVDHNNHDVRQL